MTFVTLVFHKVIYFYIVISMRYDLVTFVTFPFFYIIKGLYGIQVQHHTASNKFTGKKNNDLTAHEAADLKGMIFSAPPFFKLSR